VDDEADGGGGRSQPVKTMPEMRTATVKIVTRFVGIGDII
jgi:hypothetical protein